MGGPSLGSKEVIFVMGFFKTLFTGYKLMFKDINMKHVDLIPRCFTGCGTGLMMIGSAVAAKTGMEEDVQQVISEANAMVDEVKRSVAGEKKVVKARKIFKAKATKGWRIVKAFRKTVILEAAGAACVATGHILNENGKHKAIKATGEALAAFAGYRACVRADLGEEADRRYLTGQSAVKRTEKINKKTGEVTHELEYSDDGITIKKDPSSFVFWFSPETCPSLCSSSVDLSIANVKLKADKCTLIFQANGVIALNDMRREFGGLTPYKMDVDIGGIVGKVVNPNIPLMQQRIEFYDPTSEDFIAFQEGRSDGFWIHFPCDEQPIIGRIPKRFPAVER